MFEEHSKALLEALEKYEKARRRGYFVEENARFELLAAEVRRTAEARLTWLDALKLAWRASRGGGAQSQVK